MKKYLFLLILWPVFFSGCPSDSSDSDEVELEFTTEIIFSRGDYNAVGLTFDGLATDSDNNVHIVHESDNLELLYTTNASGEWHTIVIEVAGIEVGKYSSIAVDTQDNLHIAYFANTHYEPLGEDELLTGNLKYATNSSGTWQTFTLATGTGMTPRLCLDGSDNVHIVHSKLGASDLYSILDINYTTNITGTWETTAIKSGTVKGTDASIAVDTNGKIHISCRNEEGTGTSAEGGMGGLRYITNVSGQWTWQDVDTVKTAGHDDDIVIDSGGKIHICYLDKNAGLKYATNLSGSWETVLLDGTQNVGWNTSLKADSNNHVHISYSDPGTVLNPPGNGYLKYITNETGSWDITIVDTENAGYSTGLTVCGDNHVHIAYYVFEAAVVRGELKYATKPTLASP
ncbi:hypothetical protein ACFL27_20770 [candidate division CSSED10-310 bacterium]|uniref:Uncharacterized protein n=1 Tax=candidate division CSSED10-310 bacterium TaxID=2855610 RepID=A0ABV6Z2G0_UNCC1